MKKGTEQKTGVSATEVVQNQEIILEKGRKFSLKFTGTPREESLVAIEIITVPVQVVTEDAPVKQTAIINIVDNPYKPAVLSPGMLTKAPYTLARVQAYIEAKGPVPLVSSENTGRKPILEITAVDSEKQIVSIRIAKGIELTWEN